VAGYSGTPLATKLGVREGMTVLFLGAPSSVIEELPASVIHRRKAATGVDVAALFVTKRAPLIGRLPGLAKAVFPNGSVWVAWPKRASGVASEVTENTIREVALPTGLVDNKVCAIDETWSGLRLVWRKENRA
jgi:Protein of unknown function (DUF3052)